MNVSVYVLSSDPHSDRARRVKKLLKYFRPQIVNIQSPGDYTYENRLSEAEKLETYQFLWCLDDSRRRDLDHHVLIIKDTSFPAFSAKQIKHGITEAIRTQNWDLLYLCYWMDDCRNDGEATSQDRNSNSMLTLFSPHGTQALIFSPKARDFVLGSRFAAGTRSFDDLLNRNIENHKLSAQGFQRNLFIYDVSLLDSQDWSRLTPCRNLSTYTSDRTPTPIPTKRTRVTDSNRGFPVSYYVFIVSLVMLIIVGYACFWRNKLN